MLNKEYTLGFCTTPNGQVLLALKDEGSDGGAGYNGVGGKMEPGETPLQCMEREWAEETGLNPLDWANRGSFTGDGWRVHVFHADRFATAEPSGDQACEWAPISGCLGQPLGQRRLTSWAGVALAMALEGEASWETTMRTGR